MWIEFVCVCGEGGEGSPSHLCAAAPYQKDVVAQLAAPYQKDVVAYWCLVKFILVSKGRGSSIGCTISKGCGSLLVSCKVHFGVSAANQMAVILLNRAHHRLLPQLANTSHHSLKVVHLAAKVHCLVQPNLLGYYSGVNSGYSVTDISMYGKER